MIGFMSASAVGITRCGDHVVDFDPATFYPNIVCFS
jgi:hypothetical protein